MKYLKGYYLPITIIILIAIALMNVFHKVAKTEGDLSGFDMLRTAKVKIVKSNIDLGKIQLEGLAEARFKIINTGKVPYIINHVAASCHCTVASWSKIPVAPKDSTIIKVRYDASQPGFFRKEVTVFSNAKNSPTMLFIQGNVIL